MLKLRMVREYLKKHYSGVDMNIGGIEDLDKWKEETMDILAGRELIVSVSGGKDSTAMALLFKECNLPYRCVFMDTGWEHPATKTYLLEYLQPVIGPVVVLQNEIGGMREVIFHRNRFPSKIARFCTGELKLRPMQLYLRSIEEEVVNAVGVRAQESAKRALAPEWEYSSDMKCDVWRPILRWKEEDVIAMHHRHKVRPNPLYLMGNHRVGCWPCIFSSKRNIRILATEDPDRIEEIRVLEQELNTFRRAKDPDAPFVSWFSRGGHAFPIDKAVQWAFDDRSDTEFFTSSDREAGCMRWGLCEFQHPLDVQQDILDKR